MCVYIYINIYVYMSVYICMYISILKSRRQCLKICKGLNIFSVSSEDDSYCHLVATCLKLRIKKGAQDHLLAQETLGHYTASSKTQRMPDFDL